MSKKATVIAVVTRKAVPERQPPAKIWELVLQWREKKSCW